MKIYLDNAATTPLKKEVLEAMLPFFEEKYGNPSSIHNFGREASKYIEESRLSIANIIGAKKNEVYFTSGGTESNNWALRGIVSASKNKIKHIITTQIEHPAILTTCKDLEKSGVVITYIPPSSNGIINVRDICKAINEDTVLVSVMFANNEIGTLQPVSEIGAYCREKGVLFHTDAVQAMGAEDVNVKEMNIDLLSMSAHKFYGPKGVGALYVRSGIKIGKFITGGEQERGYRAGTLPTPLIVGMAKALEISKKNREIENLKILELREYFIEKVLQEIPHVELNGDRNLRLPGNANFSFAYIEGESILMRLDLAGIAVSSGSACASGSLSPSHVITAIGVSEELAHSTIRFSIGFGITREQMDYTISSLKKIVEDLRKMSPIYDFEKEAKRHV